MSKKSDILAKELEEKEIEIIRERINKNSIMINKLTNRLVADYCSQLDNYVRFIQSILQDDKHPPTAQELDDMCMTLPTLLFFTGEAQENLGIKADIAKAVRQEKYNSIYNTLSKGTINDKVNQTESQIQSEEVTKIIYERAYRICKEKMTAAYELLGSIKKVITRRINETSLTGLTDDRFKNN